MRIGFVGLGAMGRPMAANLARLDAEVVVHNRTRSVADAHAEAHGTVAGDLQDLAEVDVLVTCLPTTAVVAEVAARLVELRSGALWIDCTSGDPVASVALAADLAGRGVAYVDAPVSGGTNGAQAATLTAMVGGQPEDVARAQPVLEAMASRIVHLGPVGSGHAVKAINNTLLAANLVTVVEGLVALSAMGIDPGAALDVLNHASGRSFASEHPVPERIVSRTFENTFALGLLAKDVGLGLGVVDAAGDAAPALRAVHEVVRAALEHVGPDVDHTALARVVEDRAGRRLG